MKPSELLSNDHTGMRVNLEGYLLRNNYVKESAVLEHLYRHIEEMGRQYYAGNITIVDEFLQLYCVCEYERKTVCAAAEIGKGME